MALHTADGQCLSVIWTHWWGYDFILKRQLESLLPQVYPFVTVGSDPYRQSCREAIHSQIREYRIVRSVIGEALRLASVFMMKILAVRVPEIRNMSAGTYQNNCLDNSLCCRALLLLRCLHQLLRFTSQIESQNWYQLPNVWHRITTRYLTILEQKHHEGSDEYYNEAFNGQYEDFDNGYMH